MAAMLGAPAKAHGPEGQQQEKRKKESILDLTKFLEKPVRVKFAGNFYSLGLNSPLYRQSRVHLDLIIGQKCPVTISSPYRALFHLKGGPIMNMTR